MARNGVNLSYIAAECRLINDSMSTLGASVSSCTVPGVGPLFQMESDEIEIGLGVHGEAGMCRRKVRDILITLNTKFLHMLTNDLLPYSCALLTSL